MTAAICSKKWGTPEHGISRACITRGFAITIRIRRASAAQNNLRKVPRVAL